MRAVAGTIVVVLVLGYLASAVELPQAWSNAGASNITLMDGWRRTANGWEFREAWEQPSGALKHTPIAWQIHPSLLATLQVLISLFALVCADGMATNYAAARVPGD